MRDNGPLRFDGVELVPRKHVVPEYGVLVQDPGGDWRQGIPYREGDIANWCVEVGKPRCNDVLGGSHFFEGGFELCALRVVEGVCAGYKSDYDHRRRFF